MVASERSTPRPERVGSSVCPDLRSRPQVLRRRRTAYSQPPSAMKTPSCSSSTRGSTIGRARWYAATAASPNWKSWVDREGGDVTIVSTLLMTDRSLQASEQLAESGTDAEVIDLRSLRPLDFEAIERSVSKTGRLLVVEEQVHAGGWGATLISHLAMNGVQLLIAPGAVSLPDDLLISYSPPLEDEIIPPLTRSPPLRKRSWPDRERSCLSLDGPVLVDGWEQPLNLRGIALEDHEAARDSITTRDAGSFHGCEFRRSRHVVWNGISSRHHFGFRPQRVTRKDGCWQFDVLPTQIGCRVLASVRDR